MNGITKPIRKIRLRGISQIRRRQIIRKQWSGNERSTRPLSARTMSIENSTNIVTLTSDQGSGEVQYKRFTVEIPGNNQREVEVLLGYRRSVDFDEGDKYGQDYAV